MLSRTTKNFFTTIVLISTMIFGGSPSHAATMSYHAGLDLHIATQVVPGLTFDYTDGRACFPLIGPNAPYKTLYFNDLILSYNIDGDDYSDFMDYSGDRVGDTYKACVTPSADGFARATNVHLDGLVHTDSSFATSVATAFASKQITLTEVWFSSEGDRTTPQLTLKNDTTKPQNYEITGLTIDGQTPVGAPRYILIPPKSTTYLPFGSIAGNYQQDHSGISATFTLTPVKASPLTQKGLKVAKGLKVMPNSVSGWSYPSANDFQPGVNVTYPCLQLKNTSKKSISFKAVLTWKAGSDKIVGTDGAVLTLDAGQSICLDGLDSNDPYFEGDIRVGSKLNVSGSIKLVKATTFDTSAIVLGGHTLWGKPGMLYDSATKTTTIYLHVAKVSQEPNSVLNNPTINGVLQPALAVGGGCECGGGDIPAGARTIKIDKVKGDLRIGKQLAIGGTLATSPEVDVQLAPMMSGDNSYGCFLYHPEQEILYNPLTNTTEFSVNCYNHSITYHNLNLTGLTATTTESGKPSQNYAILESAQVISLPVGQSWTKRTLFRLIGDWRTGNKRLVISGSTVLE